MRRLPTPPPGRDGAVAFVSDHLRHLCGDADGERPVSASVRFRGGQATADAALDGFEVTGYARRRNEVDPSGRRGASGLSPYIRHGLLRLPDVWDRVAGGPPRDVAKFRDELLWQEYARHWYARLGTRTRAGVRARQARPIPGGALPDGWPSGLECLDRALAELHTDGWLVNQTRMWLASHWVVREGVEWRTGEDHLFRHLLDGSRAANRLGWQWTGGLGSSRHYGFSRSQVRRRAPAWCTVCPLSTDCPIEAWPDDPDLVGVERPDLLRRDPTPELTAGPADVVTTRRPAAVWLTAESLAADEPAADAHRNLPLVFVFDEPLLATLRLSSKRLVFLVETLAELGVGRQIELWLGRPAEVVADRDVAVTFAPVPGFRSRVARADIAEVHPWPWLRRPGGGPVTSFTAWRRSVAGG
jgi:deoxyribodipyrimidine photo-lyase